MTHDMLTRAARVMLGEAVMTRNDAGAARLLRDLFPEAPEAELTTALTYQCAVNGLLVNAGQSTRMTAREQQLMRTAYRSGFTPQEFVTAIANSRVPETTQGDPGMLERQRYAYACPDCDEQACVCWIFGDVA